MRAFFESVLGLWLYGVAALVVVGALMWLLGIGRDDPPSWENF